MSEVYRAKIARICWDTARRSICNYRDLFLVNYFNIIDGIIRTGSRCRVTAWGNRSHMPAVRTLAGTGPSAERLVQLIHQACGLLPSTRSVGQRVDSFDHALDALL